MNPPAYLDDAKVIKWAWSGKEPFGFVGNIDDDNKEAVFGLAICHYEGATRFYRFSCNENWEVIQDSIYNSVEEAISHLPEQYKNVERDWHNIT